MTRWEIEGSGNLRRRLTAVTHQVRNTKKMVFESKTCGVEVDIKLIRLL